MKILYFIYDHFNNPWVGGGGAVRAYELNRRLAGNGHKITILSGKYMGAINYAEGNLKYIFVGNNVNYLFSTLSYVFKAISFLRRNCECYDLIVEDFAPWNPLFSIFFTKKPVILHINHIEGINILRRFKMLGLPFFVLEKAYHKLFKYVTVLSEGTRNKVSKSKVAIIPGGLDNRIIGNAIASHNKNCEDSLLYIGRIHMKNKGLDILIAAMKNINAKLLLIGRGPDEDKIRELVSRFKLQDKIKLKGFCPQEDKFDMLKKAFFMILPSRFEGMGMVLLESAAFGKPVIVSDIPELHYAIEAGFGIAFKSGDACDLAEKIAFLLAKEGLRKEMGRKAREYAKDFTWDKIADEYEGFLCRLY